MQLFLRILGGMAIVAAGCFFVIKSEWLLQNFGAVPWAEEHLGLDGGSRLFYKLLGVIACVIGISIATGLLGNLIFGILSPFFGGANTSQR